MCLYMCVVCACVCLCVLVCDCLRVRFVFDWVACVFCVCACDGGINLFLRFPCGSNGSEERMVFGQPSFT